MTIVTNNQPRDLLYWQDLTAKEQNEFDWLDTEDRQNEAVFFRYRGWTYCLDQFERSINPKWDGFAPDSFFSGVLVKFVNDMEQVIVATYYS